MLVANLTGRELLEGETGAPFLLRGPLPITRMLKAGAVFDIIAVPCVAGLIAMANLVGLV